MPVPAPASRPQLRVVHRRSVHQPPRPHLRLVRPSLLDRRIVGDPWIIAGEDETLNLCFNDWPLARLRALALDLPALNRLFDQMRHRQPRCR